MTHSSHVHLQADKHGEGPYFIPSLLPSEQKYEFEFSDAHALKRCYKNLLLKFFHSPGHPWVSIQ